MALDPYFEYSNALRSLRDFNSELMNRLDLYNDKLWELAERYDCMDEIDDFMIELGRLDDDVFGRD